MRQDLVEFAVAGGESEVEPGQEINGPFAGIPKLRKFNTYYLQV